MMINLFVGRSATSILFPRVLLVLLSTASAAAMLYDDGSCPIMTLLPFSGPHRVGVRGPHAAHNPWRPQLAAVQSFSYMAAAQLAIEHFNARDGSVVPEVANLTTDCNVYFPKQVPVDSGLNPSTSIQHLWESGPVFQALSNGTSSFPCGVVGPIDGKTCLHLASVTEAFNIPQVYFYAESDLVVKGHQPSVVGLTIAQTRKARLIVSYLQRPGKERKYLASPYSSKPENLFLGKELPQYGRQVGLEVLMFLDEDNGFGAYKKIGGSGVKTILINEVRQSRLNDIAEYLESLNMLKDEYLYILDRATVTTNMVGQVYNNTVAGSALDKFLSGALVFDRLDGFELDDAEDPFLQAWQQQDQSTVDRLNAMFPLPVDNPAYFQASSDYFRVTRPTKYASSVYDSIMALGLGSCKMQKQGSAAAGTGGKRKPPRPDERLSEGNKVEGDLKPPIPHVASILSTSFRGASGHVSFGGDFRQARSIEGMPVGVYNIRPVISNSEKGLHSYEAVLTSVWSEENQHWKEIQDVIYRDGTTVAPSTLLDVYDPNYLNNSVRIFGLSLLAISWMVTLGGMAMVYILRKDDIVRRGQPVFLQLLCVGSAMMSTSIFTLSWDEGAGWSERQLDAACVLTPWFFFVGQTLAFSAMFTKLWRIERVMHFSRRIVTIRHVIGPLLVLLCIALVILSLWTGLDPWTWKREVILVSPSESYGECTNDEFWAYFGPLMGLIVISEAATVFFAWRTSDIQQDLSDCHGVLLAISFQLQAWLVGVPVLAVLGTSSVDATYLGRIFLIWIFSASSVLIIVWPKVYSAIQLRRHPELAQTNRVRVSISKPSVRANRSSDGSQLKKIASGKSIPNDAEVSSVAVNQSSASSGLTVTIDAISSLSPEQARCPSVPDEENLDFKVSA